jgi:sugar/nucleoside kinase (ribokinase family)
VTVAVVGNLSLDRPEGGGVRAGGPVYYAAVAAAAARIDARVATCCAAADEPVVLEPLRRTGVAVTWRESARTTAFSYRFEGERRLMALDAVGEAWTEHDVETWAAPALDGAGWVHVGALLRSDFGREAMRALTARGCKLLVDAQGLVRLPVVGPLRRDGAVDPAVLASIQALKLSESEAHTLAGGVTEESLRSLGVPEVVLTLGSSGSLVVDAAGAERVHADVVEASDPTGAGDTYALGYVAARAEGAAPVEAARSASSLVTRLLAERA